jgi:hypothetical protein
MQCPLCGQPLCTHWAVQVKGDLFTCLACGRSAIGHKPPIYSLPVYEGKVVAGCEVWLPVCEDCLHQKQKEGIENVVR